MLVCWRKYRIFVHFIPPFENSTIFRYWAANLECQMKTCDILQSMQYTIMDLVGYLNFLKEGTPVVSLNELIRSSDWPAGPIPATIATSRS